jgi:2-polyprenyl-3-methyl-5-hydroxy-6-metoxy-1,4-benzoquinol methylase
MTTGDRHGEAQALAVRLFTAGLAAAELFAAYLGMRLGLYDCLNSRGPLTAPQLAEAAGIAPRYAREWLEQQTVAGILDVDDPRKAADVRLYILPPGHAEALIDAESQFCVAPMALLPIGGVARVLPELLEAYRTGAGVAYAAYGEELCDGQSMLNRAVFQYQLPACIRLTMPDVHSQLEAGGIRVADVACGSGWSSIALARAYTRIHVDGSDAHDPAIAAARRNAEIAGVADRVHFERHDARHAGTGVQYGLVCIFDALHDMSKPIDVLRTCAERLPPGGTVLLMEPRAADTFSAPGDDVERFLYAVSLLHCLPVGLSDQPSAQTGAVIRPHVVREYAASAGFASTEVLPFDCRFHRFYRLTT